MHWHRVHKIAEFDEIAQADELRLRRGRGGVFFCVKNRDRGVVVQPTFKIHISFALPESQL